MRNGVAPVLWIWRIRLFAGHCDQRARLDRRPVLVDAAILYGCEAKDFLIGELDQEGVLLPVGAHVPLVECRMCPMAGCSL
jgi:hypothetical protein